MASLRDFQSFHSCESAPSMSGFPGVLPSSCRRPSAGGQRAPYPELGDGASTTWLAPFPSKGKSPEIHARPRRSSEPFGPSRRRKGDRMASERSSPLAKSTCPFGLRRRHASRPRLAGWPVLRCRPPLDGSPHDALTLPFDPTSATRQRRSAQSHMVRVAGWLSCLVVVAWVILMADVQPNFINDPQADIAYEVSTFYAVVALLVIWLVVLVARR